MDGHGEDGEVRSGSRGRQVQVGSFKAGYGWFGSLGLASSGTSGTEARGLSVLGGGVASLGGAARASSGEDLRGRVSHGSAGWAVSSLGKASGGFAVLGGLGQLRRGLEG